MVKFRAYASRDKSVEPDERQSKGMGKRNGKGLIPIKQTSSVKVASNLFKLIAIICAYLVLIFDGQHASNAATLYK